MRQSKGELAIAAQLRRYPGWVAEFRFDPNRKWRLDFAHPELKIGIEIDGGSSAQAHGNVWTRERDYEKRNTAIALGWRILTVSTRQAEEGEFLRYLQRMVEGRWPEHHS